MPDEIVDIVDKNDKVIGQESKNVCHKNKILHRGAMVLIFKDNTFKEILIQKRSSTKEKNPNQLAYMGGHVGAGETYLEAAKRELQEEMFHGKKLPNEIKLEELFKMIKGKDADYEFMMVYRTIYPGPFTLDPAEVDSYFFINLDEITKHIKENIENYTGTCVLMTKKYLKRYA
jgi:isopentenyldiphosphate isomerase